MLCSALAARPAMWRQAGNGPMAAWCAVGSYWCRTRPSCPRSRGDTGCRRPGGNGMTIPDAVVVGAGPNGLAAALTLARAGLTVQVFEGAQAPGGGCRTAELTLPGFVHDVCSTVHALAAASPFFAASDLAARGVRLLAPKVAAAHPLDGGRAGAVIGSVAETAGRLGDDGRRYERLMSGLER